MKGNRVVAMRELRIRSERHAAQVATMVSTHERGAGGCVCGGCVTQSRLACEKGELRAWRRYFFVNWRGCVLD
jgi:hypothetical protein